MSHIFLKKQYLFFISKKSKKYLFFKKNFMKTGKLNYGDLSFYKKKVSFYKILRIISILYIINIYYNFIICKIIYIINNVLSYILHI